MKKLSLIALALVMVGSLFAYGQANDNEVIDTLLTAYSPRAFTTQQVSDTDIDQIVKSGIKAPSARNSQPWKFTVVTNTELCAKMIPQAGEGEVIIVVSGPDNEQMLASTSYDCALATENMFIAATALGLGARIYTGPVGTVNSTLKDSLNIAEGYRVIALLRVGHVDPSVDATTAATPRNDAAETVNYVR